jgi:elongation factor P
MFAQVKLHRCLSLVSVVVPRRNMAIDRAIKVVKVSAFIKLENGPHKVINITQGKRGKGGGFVKAKLQHLFTGAQFEKTFTSDESVEEAYFEKIYAQYSWTDGEEHVFLDTKSHEEVRMNKDQVADDVTFKEGDTYKLVQCEGKFIGVELHK